MVGMMLWEPSGHWTRSVTLKEVSVLHIRFLCARMAQDRRRNPLTERRMPTAVLLDAICRRGCAR